MPLEKKKHTIKSLTKGLPVYVGGFWGRKKRTRKKEKKKTFLGEKEGEKKVSSKGGVG